MSLFLHLWTQGLPLSCRTNSCLLLWRAGWRLDGREETSWLCSTPLSQTVDITEVGWKHSEHELWQMHAWGQKKHGDRKSWPKKACGTRLTLHKELAMVFLFHKYLSIHLLTWQLRHSGDFCFRLNYILHHWFGMNYSIFSVLACGYVGVYQILLISRF